MKAKRFIIPKTGGSSFRIQIDQGSYFYDTIHFHPEHQITYFIKGEGTCFIGNHIERFQPGDVLLIGKNVPHVFRCDRSYYQNSNELEVLSTSLFFKDETFGSQFFDIPEMAHIKRLLALASKGIKIEGDDRNKIAEYIASCEQKDGFQRFQTLMAVLDIFANSKNTRTLSSISYTTPEKDVDSERINTLFHFLSTNFKSDISLNQISSLVYMTPNAFCRYFKQRTGKSYTVFLNEIRVEYAGSLIANTKQNLGNIAIDSGFNSTSYFNRQFKRITGLSPLQ